MNIRLNNGKTVALDIDAALPNPKTKAIQWLEQYRKENRMQPTIETLDTTGIIATFSDGAIVVLTVNGRFPCSLCGDSQCKHFHAALPHWDRYRWEMAERPDCPWGPTLLQAIGIVPPFIVRPDYMIKQTRWSPFGTGEEVAPGVRMWHTIHGKLFRFGNEGHVYVGSDHPDGHTDCLICRDGCDHVRQALELEAQTCES